MSRCHTCGLRNSECHTRACAPRALAVGARGSRTALDRAGGLEENGAGPSGGEGGERGIFNRRGWGEAHWAFRAWKSGVDGIHVYRTHTPRAVGARRRHGTSVHLPTTEARFMPD